MTIRYLIGGGDHSSSPDAWWSEIPDLYEPGGRRWPEFVYEVESSESPIRHTPLRFARITTDNIVEYFWFETEDWRAIIDADVEHFEKYCDLAGNSACLSD